MVKSQRKVVIDNEAKLQLRKAYNYIKKDSLQNAEKVRSKILASIKELIKNPERHPTDKYRLDKDISYRLMKYINTEFPISFPTPKLE